MSSAIGLVGQSASVDPDQFAGVWAFRGTYGAFTPLMYQPARVWSQQNQDSKFRTGVLHILAGHSGPETAADARRRRGLDAEADLAPPDPLAEESAALAGISSASIQGRIAVGRRAGGRVWRLGEEPDAPWVVCASAPPISAWPSSIAEQASWSRAQFLRRRRAFMSLSLIRLDNGRRRLSATIREAIVRIRASA